MTDTQGKLYSLIQSHLDGALHRDEFCDQRDALWKTTQGRIRKDEMVEVTLVGKTFMLCKTKLWPEDD